MSVLQHYMVTTDSAVYEALMVSALRFVSYRLRSEKEIREFIQKTLSRKHTTAPIVSEKVMSRLTEFGYVDDEKFAVWWVSQRTGRKPKGAKLIAIELVRKGIAKDLIDRVLTAIDSQSVGDEKERARRAIERKLAVWSKLPALDRKRKVSEYLYRRGFDWDTISGVVDDIAGNV